MEDRKNPNILLASSDGAFELSRWVDSGIEEEAKVFVPLTQQ